MPSMDEGGFILDYRSEPGTSLTETDRLLRQVEAILRATPEVETYSRRAGLQLGGGLTEANTGDFFVRLKPIPRRDIETVMDEVRKKVRRGVPGLEIELAQLMEDLIGDLTAVPQPIEIKLYSDDGNLLLRLGPGVAAAIAKIPGVVDVKPGIVLAGDALNIQVDRVKASLEGVDPDTITQMVSNYLSGVVTTQIQSGSTMIGVRAWIPHNLRATQQSVEELRLRAADGVHFTEEGASTMTAVLMKWLDPSLQIAESVVVAFGLRHGFTVNFQMLIVNPVARESLSGRAFALRYLVLVMRKDQINAARVNVKRLAQIFHGHG